MKVNRDYNAAIAPSRLHAPQVTVAPVRRETFEEFIARGGRAEVLASGVVSRPFKHIGREVVA